MDVHGKIKIINKVPGKVWPIMKNLDSNNKIPVNITVDSLIKQDQKGLFVVVVSLLFLSKQRKKCNDIPAPLIRQQLISAKKLDDGLLATLHF